MARKIEVQIVGDASSLERAYGRASKQTSSFGRSFGGLKVGALAAVGGLTTAGFAVKGLIDKATEAEVVNRKMQAQLEALGISYENHSDTIDKVIQKHSMLTGIDDEDLTDAFTKIVRVTGDVNSALRLNSLAADIARARNMDLGTAAELVGKVYAGKTGVLSRYGIVLDKNATSTEALAALQKKFAGQAEASATAQAKLGVVWENLQERLGARLLPLFERFANWLITNMPAIEQKVSATFEAIGRAIELVAPFIEALVRQIEGLVQIVGGLLQGDFGKVWEGIKDVWGGQIDMICAWIGLIWTAFEGLLTNITGTLGGLVSTALEPFQSAFTTAKTWVDDKLIEVVGFFISLPGRIAATFATLASIALSPFKEAFTTAKTWVGQKLDDAVGFFTALPGRIAATFVALASTALDPFKEAFTTAKTWVGARIDDIVGFFTNLPGRIAATLVPLVQSALTPFSAAFQAAKRAVVGALKEIDKWLEKVADGIRWLGQRAGAIIEAGSTKITGALQVITDAFGPLAQVVLAIKNAVAWLIDNIPNIPTPSFPDLTPWEGAVPGLAAGGIVNRPTLALIGEAGPEAVVPLSKSFGGGNAVGGSTVNVYVSGSVLSERDLVTAVRQGLIREGRRTGPNLLGGYA